MEQVQMRVKRLLKSIFGIRRPSRPASEVLQKMKCDWDLRARENARHYVATGREHWSDEEFASSGKAWVDEHIMNDLPGITGKRAAADMRIFEIGCGAGRMTRPLAELFGEVYAIDISREMLHRALPMVRDRSNVLLCQNNGTDLAMFANEAFDFVFSAIVFQHIPSKTVISNYIQEASRVLRPGCVFKFQLQGVPIEEEHADTWVGVGFTEQEVQQLASRSGFHIVHESGAGTQYYWLQFIKG